MLFRLVLLIGFVAAVAKAGPAADSKDDDTDEVVTRSHRVMKFSSASATEQPLPNLLTYSFNVSTTEEITHTLGSYMQIAPGWTIVAQGNIAYEGSTNSVNSGNFGLEREFSSIFTFRAVGTGTGGPGIPFAMGGIGTLTTNLNPLWNGLLSTRLVTSGGKNQSWLNSGVDPFGLQQQVYNGLASVGIYQGIAPGIELGLNYAYYGFFDSRPYRTTTTLSVSTQLGKSFYLTTSLMENHESIVNQNSYAAAEALSVQLNNQISVGLHGSAFQQAATPSADSGTSGIVPVGLNQKFELLPSTGSTPMTIGFAGGLDLSIRW